MSDASRLEKCDHGVLLTELCRACYRRACDEIQRLATELSKRTERLSVAEEFVRYYEGKERSAVETKAVYGIPEVLAYLKERAAWLRKEWQNGGDFSYLNLRQQECEYIASCIKDISERLTAKADDPDCTYCDETGWNTRGERWCQCDRGIKGARLAQKASEQCTGCVQGLPLNAEGWHTLDKHHSFKCIAQKTNEPASAMVGMVPWCYCCEARVPIDHVCECERDSDPRNEA